MGIFDALNTSVGGLQAQSYALQNISGNIANASTVGYKGIGTSFEDLVPQTSTPDRQVAGGVTAYAQATITTQGTVTSSAVSTNMAINGQGFFNVQKPIGIVDNTPTFNGVTDYTRRGDFQLNANGNLVNGAGYYLLGVTVDPKTGNPTGNVPQILQFQNNFIPSQATTAIQYAANLPTTPSTTAASGAKAGTLTALGGINPSDFSTNPLVLNTPAPAYASGSTTGSVVDNQAAVRVPITGATLLSGTSPSDSLTSSFAVNDTITVTTNGVPQTITFVASGATGNNQINIGDSVSRLLAKIDALSGNTPATAGSVTAGAFTTLNVSGGTDFQTFSVATDSGTATTISLSAATVAAYNTAKGTTLNAASLSATDVASLVNYQYGSTIASGASGSLVFTSPTNGSTSKVTLGAVTGTATSGTTGIVAATNTGTTPATASTVSAGAITLNSGVAAPSVTVTSSTNTSAFAALGFPATVTAARTGGGSPGSGVVTANDLTTFTSESISGGAVTAYDATGTPVNLQLRWAKTDSSALGSPHTDTWNLFYQSNPNATGTSTAWVNAGVNFAFNSNGTLTSPSGSSITLSNVAVGNQSLGSLTMNFGSGGLTQYASVGGSATINQIQQNGYAAGQLQSVAVNNDGLVVGTFSNGQNLDLAAVSLSHFNGTNYLKALDGGAYQATDQSGVAIAGATGSISGSSLEGSNTDIADEFTKLIVTQQAYSANTKVITTANSMVQDLLNVLR
ncbi:MAG: flagellar hook-basal body complex protein [Mycobacterium sp.]|nr:flagellar hook-basal body complex protein [Mycobacterium sp.]